MTSRPPHDSQPVDTAFGVCVPRAALGRALGAAAAGLGPETLDAIYRATGGLELAVRIAAPLIEALGHESTVRLVSRIGLDDDLDGGALADGARAALGRLGPGERDVLATAVVCLGTGPAFVASLARAHAGTTLPERLGRVRAAGWLAADAGSGAAVMPLPLARVAWRVWPVGAELDDALRRLLAAFSARPDERTAALPDAAWSALLAALELGRGASHARWEVLSRLDDAARDPGRRAELDRVVAGGDPNDVALRLMLARAFRRRGDYAASVRLARAALGDPELADMARLELGRAWYAWGRLAEAADVLDSIGPEAEADARIEALGTRAAIALALDDPNAARALAEEALVRARAAQRDAAAGRLQGLLASVALADARFEAAYRHATAALAAFEARGDSSAVAAAQMTAADALIGLGRPDDALARCARALEVLGDAGGPTRATVLCVAAVANLGCDRIDEAAHLHEAAAPLVDDRMPRVQGWIDGVGGLIAAARGDDAAAVIAWNGCAARFGAMGDVRLERWFQAAVWRVVGRGASTWVGGCAERAGLLVEADPGARHPWGIILERSAARQARGVVRVDVSGRWIEQAGSRHDVSVKVAPMRLLAALAEACSGEASLSAAQLFAAGWPGERASHESARARVYVALGYLRRCGLESRIRRTGDGYRLVDVEVVGA